jgi:DNA-binding transcriptional ArsR family regulator
MVNSQIEPLDRVFAALSDPTRRGLLAALRHGARTVGDLATPLPMSLVAVTKHLSVLERAGLVERTRRGRSVICTLRGRPLSEAAGWLERYRAFWDERLDALETFLAEETSLSEERFLAEEGKA